MKRFAHALARGVAWMATLGIGISATQAQSGLDSPAPTHHLFELQSLYKAKAYEESKDLSEHYLKALSQLEVEAANRADYESALEAQLRRESLIQAYVQTPLAPPLSVTLVLPAAEAKLSGSLALDRSKGVLHHWKSPNSLATWEVLRIEPTTYQVTLVYAASGSSLPLQVEFGESSALQSTSAPTSLDVPLPMGQGAQWMTATLGTLSFTKRTSRLHFKVTSPGEHDLTIKEVRLTPHLIQTLPQSISYNLGALSEFEWTQESHSNRLLELMRPHIEAYKTIIHAHLAEIENTKQPQLERSLRHELKISEEFLAKPANRLSQELSSRLSLRNLAVTIDAKAQLASDPTALQGDLIKITTENGPLTVALQGIELISPDETDTHRLKAYADYFGVSLEVAKRMAARAQELMRQSLQNKTFEIYVSAEKDSRGYPVANLFLESRQNLAQLLVSHGIAAVEEVDSRDDKSANLLRGVLLEAEAHAKQPHSRKGAWQLVQP